MILTDDTFNETMHSARQKLLSLEKTLVASAKTTYATMPEQPEELELYMVDYSKRKAPAVDSDEPGYVQVVSETDLQKLSNDKAFMKTLSDKDPQFAMLFRAIALIHQAIKFTEPPIYSEKILT